MSLRINGRTPMLPQPLLNSVSRLLSDNGTDYDLTYKTVTIDDNNPEWNPLISESTVTIKGLMTGYDEQAILLGIAKVGDSKMVISGQVAVKINDYFMISGKKWSIVNIMTTPLKNTDIVKVLQIRNE